MRVIHPSAISAVTIAVLISCTPAAGLSAQDTGTGVPPSAAPGRDTIQVAVRLLHALGERESDAGEGIWPGFRPDTIPVRLVFPDRGSLLIGWPGELPEGFGAVTSGSGVLQSVGWQAADERGAASTGTTVDGRGVAQVVVRELSLPGLLGLATHEAFHVFQGSLARPGQRFGAGENSFLVTQYPVFSEENERAVLLEGRLLSAALAAMNPDEARELAGQFVAVREDRQRRLSADLREFETAAELNEGLAEYALIVSRGTLEGDTEATNPAGRYAFSGSLRLLDDLLGDPERSIRLRFYSTGSALALLMDRLADPGWKTRLMEENLTLQDGLAAAIGYRTQEVALRHAADETHGANLDQIAASALSNLGQIRAARKDSILSVAGTTVVFVGMCGIDPQNILRVDENTLLHTRWLRPCSGNALAGEYFTPVVHDESRGSLTAVIPEDQVLALTIAGQAVNLGDGDRVVEAEEVSLEAESLTLRSARADVERQGGVIRIVPLPN
jgi:hypothetical protein